MAVDIAREYLDLVIDELERALEAGGTRYLDDPEICLAYLQSRPGVGDEELAALLDMYPKCPETLVNLLRLVDGTNWVYYQGAEIALPIFEGFYRLLSASRILDSASKAWHQESVRESCGDLSRFEELDERIDPDVPQHKWLHFANCINNGGTSRLYIDFSPANGGKSGQVVRYMHDPDSYTVAASSFDNYLRTLSAAERRREARRKAAEARQRQAEVKNWLTYSQGKLSEAIKQGMLDETIGKLKVVSLLESLPGVGKVKAKKVMAEIGISGACQVGNLDSDQVTALVDLYG